MIEESATVQIAEQVFTTEQMVGHRAQPTACLSRPAKENREQILLLAGGRKYAYNSGISCNLNCRPSTHLLSVFGIHWTLKLVPGGTYSDESRHTALSFIRILRVILLSMGPCKISIFTFFPAFIFDANNTVTSMQCSHSSLSYSSVLFC
jgi:hypothetical protein